MSEGYQRVKLSIKKYIVIFCVFALGFVISSFLNARAQLLEDMSKYNREAIFIDRLLKIYSNTCDKFEYGQYYAFQEHALTRYEFIISNNSGFPYYLDPNTLTFHYDASIYYRESWVSTKKQIEGCQSMPH
ncbi:hypothetical protein ACG1BZ_04180 [Microbulbifer sp. CNSA002]|uniref:hypothetical protein n=1 Tax=unclassified Microbulbifer TaxID=2619833 RepID=UPI0039B57AFB